MTLLLDTHAFLWFVAGDERLPPAARAHIEDGANRVWLSTASLWELAIKLSLGRLSLAQPFEEFVYTQLRVNSIELLHISVEHLSALTQLPFHHRDPFDRLLIAQTRVEGIPLVSGDSAFDAYDVRRIWE